MIRVIFFVLMTLSYSMAMAQDVVIDIWGDQNPPGFVESNIEEEVELENGQPRRVSNISNPQIHVYLPKNNANSPRTAIIVCPGGGYSYLSFTWEGVSTAEWLNELGAVGIVMKDRLPVPELMSNPSEAPLLDVQKAIELVRENADEWNIDIDKIGVMGYSAGGHLAASASTLFTNEQNKPSFSILIYPVITMDTTFTHMGSRRTLLGTSPNNEVVGRFSTEKNVSDQTPSAFIVHSLDDRVVPVKNSLAYYQSLVDHKIPDSELFVFQNGNHGYSMAKSKKGNVASWPQRCETWLRANSWIE